MPNHYSAGWWMDSSATLEEAEEKVYELFLGLKQAAATRNMLLPVGTDYTPPNKWVTEIHRDWNAALRLAALRHRPAARLLRRGPTPNSAERGVRAAARRPGT